MPVSAKVYFPSISSMWSVLVLLGKYQVTIYVNALLFSNLVIMPFWPQAPKQHIPMWTNVYHKNVHTSTIDIIDRDIKFHPCNYCITAH